jgi:hypothetical protein
MRLLLAGSMAVMLAAGSWTVTRAQQGCDFRVTPTRVELGTAAANGTVSVETQPGCAWTVTSSASWLRPSTGGGAGSGVIAYTTDAVPPSGFSPRQGRLEVRWNTPTAGQNVLVTQSHGGCNAFMYPQPGPITAETFGAKAGHGSFWVLAEPFMSGPWRVIDAPDWIVFTNPPLSMLGAGDGAAIFDVVPNPSPFPRDGIVTFCQGPTIRVHQSGQSQRGFAAAVAADFDDDGRSDPAIYRPSTGQWWVLRSGSFYTDSLVAQWGTAGTIPMPADFDGDNKTDLAVYEPQGLFGAAPAGNWNIRYSSNGYDPQTQTSYAFPTSAYNYTPQNLPLPADFNGDGKPDFVTFREATGEWSVQVTNFKFPTRLPENFLSGGEYNGHWQWGLPGDVPVPADYDGDGFAELAVWRPSNGLWFLRMSSNAYNTSHAQVYQWGLPGDRPIVGDFDGDGRADLCVWRPSDGAWYIVYSSSGYHPALMTRVQWGLSGDVPVSGDYDGDGRTDLAVWRPSSGFWYILFSSRFYDPRFANIFQWGLPGDVPLSGRITISQ